MIVSRCRAHRDSARFAFEGDPDGKGPERFLRRGVSNGGVRPKISAIFFVLLELSDAS